LADAAHRQQQLLATVARIEDRVEIIDALYRFAAGQDLRDPALFSSAFAPSAELDFVQPAKQLGVDLPVFKGRDNIASSIQAALADIDTTHAVTNTRVDINGDKASLFALVEAQHLPKSDRSRNLLLKNLYWVSLERAGERWAITGMRIENVWYR
jgi:SnoaL-like protein